MPEKPSAATGANSGINCNFAQNWQGSKSANAKIQIGQFLNINFSSSARTRIQLMGNFRNYTNTDRIKDKVDRIGRIYKAEIQSINDLAQDIEAQNEIYNR